VGEGAAELARLVEDELMRPAPEAAQRVAEEIRRRHGDPVLAIIFYGSCLRRGTSEGVLDFYALVDSYPAAYRSRRLALANALLPPNVFYLELGAPGEEIRAKYAVVSLRDFERGAGTGSLRSSVWARFCQPVLAVYVRDAHAAEALVRTGVRSVLTAFTRVVPLLPAAGGVQRFAPAEFWDRAFRETYSGEMRTEPHESIRNLYLSAPERYDRAARCALAELDDRGWLQSRGGDGEIEVTQDAWRRRRGRLAWRLRRPLAKLVYAISLFKTATTFGDWLPYVLWKLERHTGTRLVPTERQLRHPLVWAWPLLFKALWRRDLH
jgi:hypothetical protein